MTRSSFISCGLAAPLLALALACGAVTPSLLAPMPAHAETRTDDVICGKTAEKRQIAAENLPDITATHALIEGKDGTSYYERDADAAVKIASITKVMTALVTLDNVDDLSDTLTVDKEAADIVGSSAELQEGDTLTVEQALRGLMIPSGNDAALALAKYVGAKLDSGTSDPVSVFVKAMNKKAQELGCKDTLFTNPHGLDHDEYAGDQHSTARDVVIMFKEAMTNDTFRQIVADTDSHIKVTSADGTERSYEMDTHNNLLGQNGNIGGKTGTTDNAGYCFVSAYQIDGEELYMVVLDSDTDDQRYVDTVALAAWFDANSMDITPVSSKRTCADGKLLVARVADESWTDRTVNVVLADPSKTQHVFAGKGTVEASFNFDKVSGGVKAGDKVGTVTLTQDGVEVGTFDLAADKDVDGPNPLQWVLVQFDRAVRLVQGKSSVAETVTYATNPEMVDVAATETTQE